MAGLDCISEEHLERYQRGEFDALASGRFEEHLGSCSSCAERLGALRRTQTMLDEIRVVLSREAERGAPVASPSLEGRAFGAYRVGALLGEGGMARVYAATHADTGSPAALKVLKAELVASADIRARFEREARTMAKIQHPHVVRILDCPSDQGTTAIAMEKLDGGTLKQWADRQHAGGRMDHARLVAFSLQAARGLGAAHDIGVVHRDVKPSNLLLAADGTLKVVDFGVVQALESATWVTGLGHHIGTPAYMSPEQCGGQRASPASDVYSFGVTLYELMARRLPFEVDGGSPFAHMLKHLSDMPADIRDRCPEAPDWLGDIVMRCLNKDPAKRFESGAALAAALEAGPTRARADEAPKVEQRPTWHLDIDAVRAQLRRLPQRAIVAWACRCARRVQYLNADPRVERAVSMAEGVCRGAEESRSTSKALQRVQQLRTASLKAAYVDTSEASGESEAARQAGLSAAAASACAAARNVEDAAADAAFAAGRAVAALRAEGKSARPFWQAARRDFDALFKARLGKEGTIGDPVPESFWRAVDARPAS